MELARSTPKPIILIRQYWRRKHEIAKLHTSALANDDRVVRRRNEAVGHHPGEDFRSFVSAVKILSLPAMKGNNLIRSLPFRRHCHRRCRFCERYGFRLLPLAKELTGLIHSYFRAKVIQPTNPLDLGDLFDFDLYTKILDQVLRIKDVDGFFSSTEPPVTKRSLPGD